MTTTLEHVLCIDDEEDILEVARMCLETVAGFRVSCLGSGAQAIEKAAGLSPDFVLLDVMMPGMDGPSTLRKLQEQPFIRTIPVAFMTARVQPSEIQEYLAMGAAGIIPKPFDPMALSDQITDIWNRFHDR